MITSYIAGWPETEGWYDCMMDGNAVRLKHFVCKKTGTHHWIYPEGNSHGGFYIEGEADEILYKEGTCAYQS